MTRDRQLDVFDVDALRLRASGSDWSQPGRMHAGEAYLELTGERLDRRDAVLRERGDAETWYLMPDGHVVREWTLGEPYGPRCFEVWAPRRG